MCGLVGVAGIITKAEQDAFFDLLVFSSVRGPHSTGVALVNDKNETSVFKQVGSPYELFDSKSFHKGMEGYGKRVLLGHNRYATIGNVNRANAHPFDFPEIVGMHNGTLTHASRGKLHNNRLYDTDSQSALSHINEFDIEDTVKHLDGAYAFVWYDKISGEICFIRNEERTLFYTFNEDRACIFWASEAGMLHAALMRHKIKYGDINSLTPHMYTSWEVPLEFKDRFPAGYTERKELKPEPKPSYYQNYGGIWKNNYQKQLPLEQKKTEEKKETENKKTGQVVPINKGVKVINYKGYDGELLIPAVMEHILQDGCAFCSSSIETTDTYRFISKKEVLCENCMKDPEILSMCNIDVSKEAEPEADKAKMN